MQGLIKDATTKNKTFLMCFDTIRINLVKVPSSIVRKLILKEYDINVVYL